MSCEHNLDAEYLYPADARVAGIDERDGGVVFTVVLPCPDCDEVLAVEATAGAVEETDLTLPMDDAEEGYD